MYPKTDPRFTSQKLTAQITKHIEELAEATDAARISSEMQRYLELCAKFHSYSWCNTWLIMMTYPNATHVAGFRKWQSMGRFVRKGERGIPILAPIMIKEKNENSQHIKTTEDKKPRRSLCGFKVVFVFDVSQTDGEPLPEPPDWTSPEKNLELQERLMAFAQERGITVTEKILTGEVQGVSRGGSIELSPSAGTATLIHEIAHELLHKQEERWTMSREEKELEAESVAFVVAKHFGLEAATSAIYIAMWRGGKDAIPDHLERIHQTSKVIIESVSQDLKEGICAA